MNPILRTNKQLLAMLKENVKNLEKRQAQKTQQPHHKIPSAGQAYFYRSSTKFFDNKKATGAVNTAQSPFFPGPANVDAINSALADRQLSAVQIEQDAAFVVTDLYVTSTEGASSTGGLRSGAGTTTIVLENMSSGRTLTIPTSDTVLLASDAKEYTLMGDALSHFVSPGIFTGTTLNATMFDRFYKFPVEYLVPRGAVLAVYRTGPKRVKLPVSSPYYVPGQPEPKTPNQYVDFVLGGYKVFGA